MLIKGCSSVALVRMAMRVDQIHIGGRQIEVVEKNDEKDVQAWIPKILLARIAVGSEIEILSVPSGDLSITHHVFVVCLKKGGIKEVIYSQSSFWEEQYYSLCH